MKTLHHRHARKKGGQTIIEFALVFTLFMFMLVLTVNATIAFCTQQYMSYAVFMAARAYQAGGATESDNFSRAIQTLRSYVPNLPADSASGLNIPLKLPNLSKPIATVRELRIQKTEPYDYGGPGSRAGVGIELMFDVPFVDMPLNPAMKANFSKISLRASSFFGREVSQSECKDYFPNFLTQFVIEKSGIQQAYESFVSTYGGNMEDNGC